MSEYARRVALITGASRGLGRELARAFRGDGADLFLTGRDVGALAEVEQVLREGGDTGASVRTFACDAASVGAGSRTVEAALSAFGRIDILVCNAAIQGPIGSFWENDLAAWEAALAVDLVAPIQLVHAALPEMQARGGSVLFISGGGATAPRPRFSAYATAKAGLVRFAETLACELMDAGITVNCIAPGAMPTAMLREVAAAGSERAGSRETETAGKVLSEGGPTMKRAAELAVFLASERARGITGRLISAVWDRWEDWPQHLEELAASDLYTLRRITGRDRGVSWGDK